MVDEATARLSALDLSREFPGRRFQVYRTPSGSHWVRGDGIPLEKVDGVKLVHIDCYLDGHAVGKDGP